MENLEDLKNKALRIRASVGENRRLRWPKPFRKLVMEAVEKFGDHKFVAKKIGVSHQTIRNWQAPVPKTQSQFREVDIVENSPSSISLRWEGGLEVQGLSFEQLQSLLREGLL